jgi:hypothetical protein
MVSPSRMVFAGRPVRDQWLQLGNRLRRIDGRRTHPDCLKQREIRLGPVESWLAGNFPIESRRPRCLSGSRHRGSQLQARDQSRRPGDLPDQLLCLLHGVALRRQEHSAGLPRPLCLAVPRPCPGARSGNGCGNCGDAEVINPPDAGSGRFTVGESSQTCTAGMLVLAPAGVPHGVYNDHEDLLTFLTVIAPFG